MDKLLYTGGNQPNQLRFVLTKREYMLLKLGASKLLAAALVARALGVRTELSVEAIEDLKADVIDEPIGVRPSADSGEDYVIAQDLDPTTSAAEEDFVGRCVDAARAALIDEMGVTESGFVVPTFAANQSRDVRMSDLETMANVASSRPQEVSRDLSATQG